MKSLITLISTLALLLFAQNVNANWGLKIGGNYSYLKQPSYGEPGVDVMYGISKDWSLYRWIQLRTELLISHSSTTLKDRSVQSSFYYESFPYLPDEPCTIRYFNIDIHLRYLEIPLLLKVEKSLGKNLSIGMEIGYSLKFPPKDNSKNIFLREIESTELTEDERKHFRFDYRITKMNENYDYSGRGLCPNVGMYVNYMKFQIGLRYQVDNVKWVSEIVIGEDIPFHIINFSMGYQF